MDGLSQGRKSAQSALIRAARRDSLRATVFLCITPFVVARCSSGCATLKADCAAVLSPVSIALSTFLTKVRTRLNRERLVAVRFSVCRRRFSADLWCGIGSLQKRECGLYRRGPSCVNCGPSTAAASGPKIRSAQAVGKRSAVLKSGLALGNKGGHALLLILGCEGRMEETALEAHAFGEGRLEGAIDRLLDHHRNRARQLADALGDRNRFFEQFIGRHDAADEPRPLRLGCIHHAAGQAPR